MSFNCKIAFGASSREVFNLRVSIPTTVDWISQQSDRINNVGFATIVLPDKNRKFLLKAHVG